MVSKEYGERIFEGIGGNLKKKKDYKKVTVRESKCLRKQRKHLESSEKEMNKSRN